MMEVGELLNFADRNEWRDWLSENHASQTEAWLALSRKHAAQLALSLEAAVEEALCFGWIDGILKPLDKEKFALRFSPRKDNSVWSESNKQRALRLIEQGRMTEAGLDKVRAAQASGEWERATSREVRMELPAELASALATDPQARQRFESLSHSYRKQLIGWLASARREATRHKRLQEILRLAQESEGQS
jgi:uncharacterized protein YdeI (YjbR/CyaY-like superfamily)